MLKTLPTKFEIITFIEITEIILILAKVLASIMNARLLSFK